MQNNQDSVLTAALRYEQLGWSVIPVRRITDNPDDLKKALVPWKQYESRRATPEEIRGWYRRWPHMGIAVVTGAISGVVVLDLDAKHSRSAKELASNGYGIPATTSARTGGGGEHFFFRYDKRVYKNYNGDLYGEGLDIRTDGGYAIIEPTMHQSGNTYKWMVPPEDGIADVPEWLIDMIEVERKSNGKTSWQQKMTGVIPEGTRNGSAASVVGKILHDLDSALWESVGWPGLQAWNTTSCVPPLSEKELRSVFDSIASRAVANPKKDGERDAETQATHLAESIASNPAITLFHDEYNDAFVRLPVGGHKETLSLTSSAFKTWLSSSFYRANNKKVLGATTVTSALSVIEGIARFDGPEHKLYNRAAHIGDDVWYDLANDSWQAVKITASGWQLVDEAPIIFKRYTHHAPQVAPVGGGSVMEALDFVNVTDEDLRILFVVYLVSCFIPGFAHPMPYVFGAQGSAKSSFFRVLRRLADPSKTEVLIFPRDKQELAQQLLHYHVAFYDNLHYLSQDMSDVLCQAITGGGFSKRRLYSDSDDVVFSLQSIVGLNGISLMSDMPDLLDRSILFELQRIEEGQRKNEAELAVAFEAARPRILGAIFDAVAGALARYPDIKLTKNERMADFCKMGAAIADAVGIGQEAFLAAYHRNVESQSEEIIESDVVATTVVDFMSTRVEWEGTVTHLFLDFAQSTADDHGRPRFVLPKSPKALSQRLNVLKVPLAAAGIGIERRKEHSGRRIRLYTLPAASAASVTSVPEE